MNRLMIAVFLLLPAFPGLRAQPPETNPPATLAAPLAQDPLGATIHRLSNGLTVYLSPYRQEPRISAWIVVRAGGKSDPSDSTGMAHYLEHMLFKGSTSLGTLDYEKEKPHLDRILALYEKLFLTKNPAERAKIYQEIDAENSAAARYAVPNEIAKAYRLMGFQGVNAFTSNEHTAYVCDFPSNRAEAWAKLEAERFAHPVFRLFQTEIETVYEEKNRSADNAERILDEALQKKLFSRHPYGETILGSIEHLKNPSLAKMYAFYRENYVPDNMAIVLSGDFDRAPMLALLEKYFGAWRAAPAPKPRAWPLPKPRGTERVSVSYESEEKVVLAWPTVANRHPDADALGVLDMLMDNSVAGIINLSLNQAQKVRSAGSYPILRNDAGAWYLWAVPKKDQTLEQAEARLLETVGALKAGEFSDEDIRAIVTDFEVDEKRRLESNGARVAAMGGSFAANRPWKETVERLDRMRRVTKADVLRVAEKYLGADRVVAYRRNAKPLIANIAKPQFTKIEIDASRESAFFKEVVSAPAVPLQPKWLAEGRDYSILEGPSGALYAAANPVNDLFSLSFHFERGRRQERALCAALELLDLSGAGRLSAEEFKKRLYRLGTTLDYSCSEQESGVHVSGLDKNLEESLALMFERFDSPRVASDTLKTMAQVAIGAHRDNKRNPGAIVAALGQLAARGKDSAVLSELTDQEWLALKEEELEALIRHVMDFKRRTAYIGNRPPRDVARLSESGRARYQSAARRVPLRYVRPDRDTVYFTHRDMVQAQVGFTAPDEVLDPARAVDYNFYGSYLSGGMSSVIFQEVRESRSLAYEAWARYDQGAHKGDESRLHGMLGCQADKTVEAAALMRRLMLSPPPSAQRFAATAKAIEENYRANPVTFRSIPYTVMAWEDQGIVGDPRPERFQRSLKYTLSDLLEFSRRFEKKPLAVYILGQRDRVGRLTELGRVEEKTPEQIFPY